MDADPHGIGRSRRIRHPKLTGYRLLLTTLIFTFGTSKALLAYQGQSAVPTALEWISGVFIGIGMFWLGAYEEDSPGCLPWLFDTDYGRPLNRLVPRKTMRRALRHPFKLSTFIIADILFAYSVTRALPSLTQWALRDFHPELDDSDYVGVFRFCFAYYIGLVLVCGFIVAVVVPVLALLVFLAINLEDWLSSRQSTIT